MLTKRRGDIIIKTTKEIEKKISKELICWKWFQRGVSRRRLSENVSKKKETRSHSQKHFKVKYPEAEYLKKIQAGDEKSTGNLTESNQKRNHLNRLAAGDDLGREYLRKGGTVRSTQVLIPRKIKWSFRKSIFLKVVRTC